MVNSDQSRVRSNVTRRRLLALTGAGATGLFAGCSGDGTDTPTDAATETTTEETTTEETTTEETTAEPTTTEATTETTTEAMTPVEEPPEDAGSYFDPSDGFADPAPWLESEAGDVSVYTVEEPTREAFADAVNNSGPRVVVFETSGTIDLDGDWVDVTNDKLWLAGQTAPSPGITLVRGRLSIDANDCVVQHIRVQAGDEGAAGEPSELDAINTTDGSENNVIDHCSASWSIDETLSVGYDTNNTTISNCLIYEALWGSDHPKGPHSYSSLTGNNAKNVAYLGNVRAHAIARNPRLKTGVEAAVVNEVVYDFRHSVVLDDDTVASIVGNSYVEPESEVRPIVTGGRIYREGNFFEPEDVDETEDIVEEFDDPKVWPDGLEAMDAEEAQEHALAHVGARPTDRTPHDERIIADVENRENTGGFINSQDEVDGYSELEENTHELTIPDENLRYWLQWHALAVEDPDVSRP